MDWLWLALAVALAASIAVILFMAIHVHVRLEGRGDPSGAWALAGATQLGPFTISGVGAHGVEPSLQLHLFGKRVIKRPLTMGKREPGPSIEVRYRKLERWVDPIELGLFVVRERRRIHVPELEVEVDYSFENVALTGQIMGALFALDAMLPAPLSIKQRPSWDARDRAALRASSTIVFRIAPLAYDAIVFIGRNLRIKNRRRELAARAHLKIREADL